MAKEMQSYFADRMRSMQTRSTELPRELLAARIARLRERMKNGDPDMTVDELQAAIDRAELKRRELEDQQFGVNEAMMSKALAVVP